MHSNCFLDSVANLLVRHMVFVGNVQKRVAKRGETTITLVDVGIEHLQTKATSPSIVMYVVLTYCTTDASPKPESSNSDYNDCHSVFSGYVYICIFKFLMYLGISSNNNLKGDPSEIQHSKFNKDALRPYIDYETYQA